MSECMLTIRTGNYTVIISTVQFVSYRIFYPITLDSEVLTSKAYTCLYMYTCVRFCGAVPGFRLPSCLVRLGSVPADLALSRPVRPTSVTQSHVVSTAASYPKLYHIIPQDVFRCF